MVIPWLMLQILCWRLSRLCEGEGESARVELRMGGRSGIIMYESCTDGEKRERAMQCEMRNREGRRGDNPNGRAG